MNEESRPANDPNVPPPIEYVPAPPPRPSHNIRHFYWLKKLLVSNPFFLASAALLLYGMYRISIDVNFLPTETGQLTFNFSSIQLYELALVITAAILARRRIWYDSTMLVVLENLLILVPFILVSHAALIEHKWVWRLCIIAAVIAALRTDALRRRVQELWPTSRLFGIGAILLATNAALPVIYRHLHESKFGTKLESGPAYETNQCVWFIVLPALCALANLLPKPVNDDHPLTQRRWFPQALLAFWLVGTATHLYCLGYVYDFNLNRDMVTPALWVLAWTAYLKLPDFVSKHLPYWRAAAIGLPLLTTLVSIGVVGSHVFVVLTLLDVATYAVITWRERKNKIALQLGLISLAALVAAVPVDWMMPHFAGFDRVKLIGMAATAYILLATSLSRNPKLGLLGAIAAACAAAMCKPEHNTAHWAIQAGMAFFLAHSLRWRDYEHAGVAATRWFIAVSWVMHSMIWARGGVGFLHPTLAGALVLTICGVRWFVKLNWQPLVVPVAAMLVMLCSPANHLLLKLEGTPAGVIAIASSFALFAAGTVTAFTRHRWHGNGTAKLPESKH